MSVDALRDRLKSLDGQSYKAYKSLKGSFSFPQFTLFIDYVQGDPFAAPSQLRAVIPQSVAGFPDMFYEHPSRRVALEDFLVRSFYRQTRSFSGNQGSGNSGMIAIARPSQAMLPRSAMVVTSQAVEVRFLVGLPAFGRRIAGLKAATLLCERLPSVISQSLVFEALDAEAIARHCRCAENADWLRAQLSKQGFVAFVADGAILPRQSGVDEQPLRANPIPFQSPPTLRKQFTLPSGETLSGMAIPQGITLIVGGGYHGKSTLLKAIEMGIYNHIPGDGREYVVTEGTAMKVRAEDGRNIAGVNITPFINHLPQGRSTQQFCTSNASGSTSQAANIIEAVEAGAKALLIDEDTSATNFMIRDRRMQALIAKDREPITPFIDKVRQLFGEHGISTVLVMGGSGDYFDVADTVIAMDEYRPQDVTEQARAIAEHHQTQRQAEGGQSFGALLPRVVLPESIDARRGKRSVSLKTRSTDEIRFGIEDIDLSTVEQLVEPGQLKAIAAAIVYAQQQYFDGQRSLTETLRRVSQDMAVTGLDCLSDRPTGDFVAFRPLELAAAINRLRSLQVRQPDPVLPHGDGGTN